jgi:hypothetical protein
VGGKKTMKNIELPPGVYFCKSEPKTEVSCLSLKEMENVFNEKK